MQTGVIYFNETVVGKATITEEGLYYRFDCICSLPQNGIFRVYAITPFEEINLGVCIPENGKMCVTSSIPVSRIGVSMPRFVVHSKNELMSDFYELMPDEPIESISLLRECYFTCSNGRKGIRRKRSIDGVQKQ